MTGPAVSGGEAAGRRGAEQKSSKTARGSIGMAELDAATTMKVKPAALAKE
jgi:hypothetical protein